MQASGQASNPKSSVPSPVFALSVGIFFASWLAAESGAASFPEVSALPAQAALPDPFVMLDGRRVTSREQWVKERRPELKRLFEHYMYGAVPPKPARMKSKVIGQYRDFLGGMAALKLVKLEVGTASSPPEEEREKPPPAVDKNVRAPLWIDLMLILPNGRRGPAPTFLAMNFCGNQALTEDPRVPLCQSWMGSLCRGCSSGVATEASRGSQTANWPLAEIVRRGYALATFYSGDVDTDRANVSDGVYAWLEEETQRKPLTPALSPSDGERGNNPTNRGTIAAWAWGFQRCMDYLVTERDVDAARIAALGHSRNGKAALLAAAFDERIAMVFPHQAGCGGSAPSRSKSGESVKAINDRFPHWFNGRFKEFNLAPERLPFDQNCLVALCAPRPVLFSNADDDQWSNPSGQFEVLQAADGVYRFLGVEGLGAKGMPPLHEIAGGRLGYFIREGKHSMTVEDWGAFLDFTDRQWGKRSGKSE